MAFAHFFLESQILNIRRPFSKKLLTLNLALWMEVVSNDCNGVAVDNFTGQTSISLPQIIFLVVVDVTLAKSK